MNKENSTQKTKQRTALQIVAVEEIIRDLLEQLTVSMILLGVSCGEVKK